MTLCMRYVSELLRKLFSSVMVFAECLLLKETRAWEKVHAANHVLERHGMID